MQKVFLIGAQKAGTSFMHNLLAVDPRFATYTRKEPHYFSSSIHRGRAHLELFEVGPQTEVLLDSSVSYMHHETAARKIHEIYGDSAIIVAMIRRPAQRAVSAYFHSAKNGRDLRGARALLSIHGTSYREVYDEETRNIRRAIESGQIILRPTYPGFYGDASYDDPYFNLRYISNSYYEDQLQSFRELFSRVWVQTFDALVRDPNATVANLCKRLGLIQPVHVPEQVPTNETRIGRYLVSRKYLRNVARSTMNPMEKLRRLPHALRVIANDYEGRDIVPLVDGSTWTHEANRQYLRLAC